LVAVSLARNCIGHISITDWMEIVIFNIVPHI